MKGGEGVSLRNIFKFHPTYTGISLRAQLYRGPKGLQSPGLNHYILPIVSSEYQLYLKAPPFHPTYSLGYYPEHSLYRGPKGLQSPGLNYFNLPARIPEIEYN